MVKRQPRDSIRSILNFSEENQSTMKTQTDIGENAPKLDGVDETGAGLRSGIYPGLSFTVVDGGWRS